MTDWPLATLAALIISGFLLVFGVLLFLIVAIVAGEKDYEYRCVSGVVESRARFFGQPILPFTPLDGDPVGACHEP